jgi:parallel beta-helix repeat protein
MSGGRNVAAMVLVLVACVVGLSSPWLAALRESDREIVTSSVVLVTSGEDMGLGSLRQAIFNANLVQGPARIEFRTPSLTVRSPLPPLVNPYGILLDGRQAEIRAEDLEDAPLFDVASPRTVISGLKLRGVKGAAVRVQTGVVVVRNVEISGCGTGLQIGAAVRDATVQKCRFDGNGTGIMVVAGVPVSVGESTFSRHRSAGIWAVVSSPGSAGPALAIRSNEFSEDRIGVVVANVTADVVSNTFTRCREAAMFLSGRGAQVRDNRVSSGTVGVVAEETRGLVLENNEVDNNANMGVLLRSSSQALLRGNRLYANGYGITIILGAAEMPNLVRDNVLLGQKADGLFLLGASPRLSNNQVLNSGAAAIRVLDYVLSVGKPIVSLPVLENNTFKGNVTDTPVRGEYRVPPATAQKS